MVRTHWLAGLSAFAVLAGGAGCSSAGGDDHDGFSTQEWKAIMDMQPLTGEMPRNPYNHRDQDMAVAKFGQKLMFETGYSEAITVDGSISGKKGETGKVSCATCHDPAHYFVDTRNDPTTNSRTALSQGLGAPLKRASPPFMNHGYFPWAGWTGKHDSLVMHGSGVMEVGATRLAIAHYIYKNEKYRNEYNTVFPNTPLDPDLDPAAPNAARFPATGRPKANMTAPDGPWEKMDPADQKIIFQFMYNMGRIWDTYPRAIVTHGSPFENYTTGDYGALSPEAKRGLKLFIGKAACNDCHTGPILSDYDFHNIAVPSAAGAMPDTGRMADLATTKNNPYNGASEFSDDQDAGRKKLDSIPAMTDTEAWKAMDGKFRTPSLLNIAETAPYYHTGLLRTLEEVVQHYNKGGEETGFSGVKDPKLKPLGLTDAEVADLVAFLKSLTAPIEESWTKDIREL